MNSIERYYNEFSKTYNKIISIYEKVKHNSKKIDVNSLEEQLNPINLVYIKLKTNLTGDTTFLFQTKYIKYGLYDRSRSYFIFRRGLYLDDEKYKKRQKEIRDRIENNERINVENFRKIISLKNDLERISELVKRSTIYRSSNSTYKNFIQRMKYKLDNINNLLKNRLTRLERYNYNLAKRNDDDSRNLKGKQENKELGDVLREEDFLFDDTENIKDYNINKKLLKALQSNKYPKKPLINKIKELRKTIFKKYNIFYVTEDYKFNIVNVLWDGRIKRLSDKYIPPSYDKTKTQAFLITLKLYLSSVKDRSRDSIYNEQCLYHKVKINEEFKNMKGAFIEGYHNFIGKLQDNDKQKIIISDNKRVKIGNENYVYVIGQNTYNKRVKIGNENYVYVIPSNKYIQTTKNDDLSSYNLELPDAPTHPVVIKPKSIKTGQSIILNGNSISTGKTIVLNGNSISTGKTIVLNGNSISTGETIVLDDKMSKYDFVYDLLGGNIQLQKLKNKIKEITKIDNLYIKEETFKPLINRVKKRMNNVKAVGFYIGKTKDKNTYTLENSNTKLIIKNGYISLNIPEPELNNFIIKNINQQKGGGDYTLSIQIRIEFIPINDKNSIEISSSKRKKARR